MTKNEFDDMYNADDFNNESAGAEGQESAPDDDMVASGSSGLEYDISKAPKTTKGPEREDLDGQTVTVTEVKVILPPAEADWQNSRDGKVQYKGVRFILFYDDNGQREYYSGMKVFKRTENGKDKYSDPVIQNNGSNQASQLKTTYANYKGKKPEEISMNEFLSFLASKPKALLKAKEFEYNGNITKKNIVEKFVSD